MTDVVLYEVADRVATVTLNRPEARNALSAELRGALTGAIERADGDADVDVVILTGADPAFCAGLDLKELGSGAHDVSAAARGDRSEPGPIPKIPKPVIGAVNGVAITGGFELALNCDFLIASEHARFADTHSRVGIMPGWGLTVLLAEAVGVRRARELSATGNFLDADTALAWGLVNHVVPHEQLLPTCRKLAADIVSNDQAGVRRILQTYDEGWQMTGAEAWDLESRVSADWLRSGAAMSDQIEARRQAVMERGRAQTS